MIEDWIEVELGEVVSKLGDGLHGTPKYADNGDYYFINGNNLTNGKIELKENTKRVSKEEFEKYRKPLNENTILVSINGTIGNLAFYNNEKVILGKSACYFNLFEIIDKKYIGFLLSSYNFLHYAFKIATGSTIKNVPLKGMREYQIPLAPLPIQRAIVSKIEALFSDLDNGIANFKTAQAQLKIYRQAVLKKAFEGKLSELGKVGLKDDRIIEEEILKSNNTKNPNSDNLPKGWKWVKLGEVIEKPKYGTSKKCDYNNGNVGVLRIPNISNGYIDDSDLKFAEFSSAEISDYSLNEGDILTIRSNGSVDLVGKCALIKKSDVKYLYAGYLIRLRPIKDFLNSSYLLYLMFSVALRVQIESFAKSTSGVNNINSGELSNLIIPIPPTIAEQTQIVQEIESRLSVCDKVEQSISESLKKAEALRQSILKKAFEGKLLSEAEIEQCKKEADYEPASELLKKIKAEKLAKEQEQKKATTKKKSKK
ncbi:restriction endonuclease subunit S [uncultured Draconibacterium sp.]|uniref:restriction endonuclease subunit S n=1 Tax=uncultured Draconibacterium sp. TaxID=1573823 RepID=UPI00321727CD